MTLDSFVQDLVLGFRSLRRDRGYASVVILTLAFGIAANTVVFSLLNPYFLRPLPFQDEERLVQLGQIDPINDWEARFSVPQFADYREQSQAFEQLGAYHYGTRNVTGPEGAERIVASSVTGNMFSLLGTPPLLGRTFAAGEDGAGAPPLVVLGYGLWQRRYGGDPGIVGRTIRMDGVVHTVVGVMPPEFNFPFGGVKMWVPMTNDPATDARDHEGSLVVGRLAEGWTPERARGELNLIQARLAAAHPEVDGAYAGIAVTPLREALNFAWDILRMTFAALLGAMVFILLIACVNVASLVVARATARTRDVAVRSAIGATRGRVVRQMLTENLVLAIAGGLLGVALAFLAVRGLSPFLPEDLFRIGDATIDGTVLGFTVILVLLTPILFGLLPALSTSRTDLATALKEGSAGAGVGRSSMRLRRGLIVAEIALAMVLVVGASLMLRSLLEIQKVDLGFEADRLLTIAVTPPESDYSSAEEVNAWFERATEQLEALPGVRAAGVVNPLPLNHENFQGQFARPGHEPPTADDWPVALHGRASAGYFEAMGVPILEGRTFDDSDGPEALPVVIVSRALADRYWEDESPLGQTLLFGDSRDPTEATVIGVVGDLRHAGIDTPVRPHIYRPFTQQFSRRRFVVVQTEGAPAALAGSARQTLASIDSNLPFGMRPMSEIVLENTMQWTIGAGFLGLFGTGAILLAALGVFGVMTYSVARRRRELGIRAAIGAQASQLRGLIVGEGLRLAAIGIGIGLLLAVGAGRLMASLLFGIDSFDPVSFAAVAALFIGVAVAASLVPARHAARADVMSVLRYE
jgi:putative ABC transport system permease protein